MIEEEIVPKDEEKNFMEQRDIKSRLFEHLGSVQKQTKNIGFK